MSVQQFAKKVGGAVRIRRAVKGFEIVAIGSWRILYYGTESSCEGELRENSYEKQEDGKTWRRKK